MIRQELTLSPQMKNARGRLHDALEHHLADLASSKAATDVRRDVFRATNSATGAGGGSVDGADSSTSDVRKSSSSSSSLLPSKRAKMRRDLLNSSDDYSAEEESSSVEPQASNLIRVQERCLNVADLSDRPRSIYALCRAWVKSDENLGGLTTGIKSEATDTFGTYDNAPIEAKSSAMAQSHRLNSSFRNEFLQSSTAYFHTAIPKPPSAAEVRALDEVLLRQDAGSLPSQSVLLREHQARWRTSRTKWKRLYNEENYRMKNSPLGVICAKNF